MFFAMNRSCCLGEKTEVLYVGVGRANGPAAKGKEKDTYFAEMFVMFLVLQD